MSLMVLSFRGITILNQVAVGRKEEEKSSPNTMGGGIYRCGKLRMRSHTGYSARHRGLVQVHRVQRVSHSSSNGDAVRCLCGV